MALSVPMGAGIDARTTPRDLFAALDAVHHFDLDAASSHDNALCALYSTLEGTYHRKAGHSELISQRDGLHFSWGGVVVFCNPPYGRGLLLPFVSKAWHEVRQGCPQAVLLLPVRTEQPWFHQFVWDDAAGRPHHGVEVDFLSRRVKYDGLKAGAPFPSMVVTWSRP